MRRMSSATTAACSPRSGATPPDHARAAAERHHRERGAARTARAPRAPARAPAGQDHRVGRALGLARRAAARDRGSPCRRRAATRSAWSSRTPLGADDLPQRPPACCSLSAGGEAHLPERDRRARGLGDSRRSRAGSASACAGSVGAVAPGRPTPTSASPADRLRQPLIRSRPSSASSIVAAAARRTM